MSNLGDERLNSHDCDRIVIEDGWDVFGGKLVGSIADEQTGFADSTITDDNTSIAEV